METNLKSEFKNVYQQLSLREKQQNPELITATRKVRRVIIKIVQMSEDQNDKSKCKEGMKQYEN